MPPPRPVRRTTDEEFEALAGLCERLSGFGEYLPFDYVDGFLTAVVCAPLRVPLEQVALALAGEAYERACADPLSQAEALAALGARVAAIETALDPEALLDAPDALRLDPLLMQVDEAARERWVAAGRPADEELWFRPGAFWAEGFLAGRERLADALGWPAAGSAGDEALQPLLAPLRLLHEPSDSEAFAAGVAAMRGRGPAAGTTAGGPPDDTLEQELMDDALFAVQDLRLAWIDEAPRVAPRRVEATPGRNDPCPCGSGRKYKKCHGAAA
jgi:uncharacterized protein